MPAFNEAIAALPPIEEMDAEDVIEPEPIVALGDEPDTPAEESDADDETPVTEEEPAEETPEPETVSDAEKKARAFDNLNEALTRDPVGYARALLEQTLTPEQRAALGIQTPAPAPAELGEGWKDDELTEPEKFVKANHAFIRELPRWSGEVATTMNNHHNALVQHDNDVAALRAQVDALSLALGIELPAAKFNGIDPDARAAYAKSLREAAGKKAAVSRAAATPTPRTPNNAAPAATAETVTPKEGESLMSLFRKVKASSR